MGRVRLYGRAGGGRGPLALALSTRLIDFEWMSNSVEAAVDGNRAGS